MSISEQALFLLDIQPSISARKSLESFGNLDSEINESILPAEARPEAIAAAPEAPSIDPSSILASVQTPFAVAARMGRPDYEEKAKAEALHQALRQMRAKHAAKPSPRVIRGS